MIPIEEQINSHAFYKFCDYYYSPRADYDWAQSVLKENQNMTMFCPGQPMQEKTAIIFIGANSLIEEVFQIMPKEGNYIIIIRDTERTFHEDFYRLKPESVKHIYTIECAVNHPDVTAMPFGVASIYGPNYNLERVRLSAILDADRPVFCRMNTNSTERSEARKKVIEQVRDNPLVDLVEFQLEPWAFFRHMKAHPFTLSLQSGGKDTTRTWETLCLGRIPIISDCFELRFFEDMPVAYYPEGGITKEWIDGIDLKHKSIERAKMSYWRNLILEHRRQLQ